MIHLDITKVFNILASNANIKSYYIWYINHCTSLTLPYHNLSHTMKMMYLIIDMYERNRYDYKLEATDLYILLTSALFHDYNHSGGRFSDTINVENAVSGLNICMNTFLQNDETTNAVIMQCVDAIRGTEYPYVINENELNIYQKILRECDILVVFFDDFINHNIFGLCEEMKKTDNIGEFIQEYYKFVDESLNKLSLQYSREIINENIDSFNDNIKSFLNVLI